MSASVSWTASAGATGYTVNYSTGGTTQTVAVTQPPCTLTGLAYATTYTVTVSAVDGAGSSAPSGAVSVTTLSAIGAWKLANYGSSTVSDTSAPDGDGLPILLKYATHLVPGRPGTNPVVAVSMNNGLQVQFIRLDPATVTYTVQGSDDASTWTTVASLAPGSSQWSGPGTVSETAQGGGTISVNATDSATAAAAPRRFLRLQVSDPGP